MKETKVLLKELSDKKREIRVNELKVQWFNYTPPKRVSLIRQFPEIAEQILYLIEQSN